MGKIADETLVNELMGLRDSIDALNDSATLCEWEIHICEIERKAKNLDERFKLRLRRFNTVEFRESIKLEAELEIAIRNSHTE